MSNFNCILIRYGEIFLKGNNKFKFIAQLIRNIKIALKGLECNFITAQSRFFVEDYNETDFYEIVSRLKKVCGIHSISPTVKVKTNMEQLCAVALEIAPKKGSFRVSVNRADKKFLTKSMDVARQVGGYVLSNTTELSVDLFKFDYEINIDIRENGFSYIFYEKIACQRGLPIGSSGNAMLLLSGGIDSPVAGYRMAQRGVKIFAIHFHSYPYTSELALEKVKDLASKMAKYCTPIELAIVPFTDIQYAIHTNCKSEFMITLMRRIMMRIAERLAKNKKCGAIITGESLGQVASQTMESIFATNIVVSMPVFRPLIGFDKEEIIEIAKKIDTFDISIRPYEDCCTVFLPKNPTIHPKMEAVLEEEAHLDVENLIEAAIMNTAFVVQE